MPTLWIERLQGEERNYGKKRQEFLKEADVRCSGRREGSTSGLALPLEALHSERPAAKKDSGSKVLGYHQSAAIS